VGKHKHGFDAFSIKLIIGKPKGPRICTRLTTLMILAGLPLFCCTGGQAWFATIMFQGGV
jgi:hypothetical protein